MKAKTKSVKIGIVGCGAIGSRLAKSIQKDLRRNCRLTGLFDVESKKARELAKKLTLNKIVKKSLSELITSCDCMIEAFDPHHSS